MKTILLFLSVFLSVSLFGQVKRYKASETNIYEKKEFVVLNTNGETVTGIIDLFESGIKVAEISYEKGKKTGLMKLYYSNGRIKSEISFINGIEHGDRKDYFENDSLKFKISMENGLAQGKGYEFNKYGTIKTEISWKNSKRDGPTILYNDFGVKTLEANYENDKLNGLVKEWSEDGERRIDAIYVNDVQHSKDCFNSNGDTVSCYPKMDIGEQSNEYFKKVLNALVDYPKSNHSELFSKILYINKDYEFDDSSIRQLSNSIKCEVKSTFKRICYNKSNKVLLSGFYNDQLMGREFTFEAQYDFMESSWMVTKFIELEGCD